MVGQPMVVFNATIEAMVIKGYVSTHSDGQIKLLAEGKVMAKRLFDIAKSQEEAMLTDLNEPQRVNLKRGLKHIAEIDV